MNLHRNLVLGAGCILGCSPALQAQPTISASDMFNQAGQYYRAYANDADAPVDVSSLLGSASDVAQAWNFTTGPQDVVYRFDYVPAAEAPAAGDFPTATLAEKKTDEADPASPAWLYFNQDPAKGRLVSGFYDPAFGFGLGSSDPRGVFNPVLNDFPQTISFGDEWSSTTVFTNEVSFGDPEDPEDPGLFTIPIQITYTAAAKVDAYGVAISPGISFGDCLRINELVTYDIAGDFGEGFQHLETDYIRNFYWARPGRGIVTQVTSQQQTSPPPDSFPMAAVVLRMFETNHPDSEPPPPPGIQGLTIALSKQGALLTWDRLSGVTSYRVEYTSEPGNAGGWQTLQSPTTSNFLIDDTATTAGATTRCYRVVGLK